MYYIFKIHIKYWKIHIFLCYQVRSNTSINDFTNIIDLKRNLPKMQEYRMIVILTTFCSWWWTKWPKEIEQEIHTKHRLSKRGCSKVLILRNHPLVLCYPFHLQTDRLCVEKFFDIFATVYAKTYSKIGKVQLQI